MAIDIIMTADEFIEKAKLAESTPSCYVTGCFGAPLDMSGVIERWETEYTKNKKYDALMRERAALAVQQGTHCFGFDCVNLIKAILWGWHLSEYERWKITHASGLEAKSREPPSKPSGIATAASPVAAYTSWAARVKYGARSVTK